MATSDDGRLAELARKGDIEAFGELYKKYSPRVYNLVLRMLGNSEEAEDVRQDVFVKAFKSLRGFRGQSSFTTWIYRIATNQCLDVIRRRKSSLSTEEMQDNQGWELTDSTRSHNPEESLLLGVTIQAVEKALRDTPEHYRVLIVLRHIENLSYEEIAAVLGCSQNSLNVRLHRARESFKKALLPYLSLEDTEAGNELQQSQKKNIAFL